MTKLVTGRETLNAIELILNDAPETYMAVAYWSLEAAKKLTKMANGELYIVLDVNAGGTSADALSYLIEILGNKVRVHPNLHTKIYASQERALIGSSNASWNGLHLGKSSREEASVLVSGHEADEIFSHAKNIFLKAEEAGEKHIEVCQKRFNIRTIATQESNPKAQSFLDSLWENHEFLRDHPVIYTWEETDTDEREKAFNDVSARIKAEDESEGHCFEEDRYTDFQFSIPKKYIGKKCISLHRTTDKNLTATFVIPSAAGKGKEWSFAKMIDWKDAGYSNYNSYGYRKLDNKSERYTALLNSLKNIQKKNKSCIYIRDLRLLEDTDRA